MKNNTKYHLLFLAIFFCWLNTVNAQSFLNGSFETTSSPASCNYNMSNATYNSLMPNSRAFGAYQALDIVLAGCFIPSIAHGTRAVSIANNPPNNTQGEAISLALSAPLVAGNTYTISFEAYAITSFGPQGNLLIGASTSDVSFGTTIYTANTIVNTWTTFTFSFTAPSNSTHITIMPVPGVSSWNSIDNFSMLAVLPIESLKFDASLLENQQIKLEWQTTSEINNDYFTVERSKHGISWETLSNVDAAGYSTSILNYNFIDQNPYLGTSYYRLKQTDFDGQFSLSPTISIEVLTGQSEAIDVYPNPTFQQITLKGADLNPAKIKIYNILGQDLTALSFVIEHSENTLVLDLSNLDTGMYYIKTKTSSNIVHKL